MSEPPEIEELLAPSALPVDHDPLGEGILMAHQRAWLDDPAPLKLAAKGRRTGITYAEALDDTLIAAASRAAGGDNVYYIGDTKEKGLEYIRYVAHFARIVARETAQLEEFLFEDKRDDGSSKHIAAYRIRFASGYQVAALSSRPANIRGLQGVVVIDEAAYHADVKQVLDAVNALLIWGGKIRIVSTHNGEDNPFNDLIKDTRKGLYDYSIHTIPFSEAVKNGLYERVCLMRGWTATPKGKAEWLDRILRAYGPRHEQRDEELEAVPRKSSGAYLPRALVQHAQVEGVPILSWAVEETFFLDPDRERRAEHWIKDHLEIPLSQLDWARDTVFGQDFGRSGDLSVIAIAQRAGGVLWRAAAQIELRRVSFDVQRMILFWIVQRLPRLRRGAMDARGNGQSHAEAAQQKFGLSTIDCVMATPEFYATEFPEYRGALEDRSFLLPASEDVLGDHRLAVLVKGRPTIGDGRTVGSDGEQRHGDSLVAWLLCHAATRGQTIATDGYIGARELDDDGPLGGGEEGRAIW